ncbi:MAG: peptidylprolyl isomerase, partial [Myxococcota bacterium]
YQANAHRYTDLEKQVRARHILIDAPEDADETVLSEKRAEAERLLAQVREGGDFAELASEHSADPGSASRGGDLGWNPEGRMVPEFDEVQFALEPGEVSDVVETEFGFHIIKVEEVREGDVPEQEAKREIAERLYAERRAEQLAREAAQDALAALDEGTDLETLDVQLGGPKPDDESAEDDRDPNAPKVVEPQAFARGDNPLPAGTDAGPLVTAAFDRTEDDPLPDEPLKVGNDWFVFKVLEHTEAKREDFAGGTKQRLLRDLNERKAEQALRVYVQRLREEAEADDVIQLNEGVLSYGDDDDLPTEAS